MGTPSRRSLALRTHPIDFLEVGVAPAMIVRCTDFTLDENLFQSKGQIVLVRGWKASLNAKRIATLHGASASLSPTEPSRTFGSHRRHDDGEPNAQWALLRGGRLALSSHPIDSLEVGVAPAMNVRCTELTLDEKPFQSKGGIVLVRGWKASLSAKRIATLHGASASLSPTEPSAS